MPAADGGWDRGFWLVRFRVRGLLAVVRLVDVRGLRVRQK